MLDVWSLQWQNHNQLRSYPLNSLGTQTDITGAFKIPDDFINGLKIAVINAQELNPAGFYISSIGAYDTTYSIEISYTPNSSINDTDTMVSLTDPIIAVAYFAASNVTSGYSMIKLKQVNEEFPVSGFVCIGSLNTIKSQPTGKWLFTYSGGVIDPDVVNVAVKSSPNVYFQGANEQLYGPFGNIVFKGDDTLKVSSDTENNVTVLTFSVNQ